VVVEAEVVEVPLAEVLRGQALLRMRRWSVELSSATPSLHPVRCAHFVDTLLL
jgi:hypothetical protein